MRSAGGQFAISWEARKNDWNAAGGRHRYGEDVSGNIEGMHQADAMPPQVGTQARRGGQSLPRSKRRERELGQRHALAFELGAAAPLHSDAGDVGSESGSVQIERRFAELPLGASEAQIIGHQEDWD